MLSRGILIQFNVIDDIDYHRPRWSLKFLFFLHTSIISSSSPYRTAQFIYTGSYDATASHIMDRAMAEFRQRFV
jgi:hypothetical protein